MQQLARTVHVWPGEGVQLFQALIPIEGTGAGQLVADHRLAAADEVHVGRFIDRAGNRLADAYVLKDRAGLAVVERQKVPGGIAQELHIDVVTAQ
ncbi:hypothetical protein D3C85_1749050 [compost metagenome]